MKKPCLKKVSIIVCMLLSVSVISCGSMGNEQEDILSQKPLDKKKTQITVLTKHAFSINGFEKAVEEKFPDIDIVQVGNYTTAMSPDEMEARMKHDDLTDIIMTWPKSFGEEYCEERLLDLSVLPITNKYNTSMLNEISKDGKLYYIPGPAQVRGIVYNKTLFEEKGWNVPTDYESFLALCQDIEATGIRSIQLGFANKEVLDTAFIGYGYGSSFSKPKDAQWIADYAQGKGRFLDQFDQALITFQQMKDLGIWKAEDLEVDYSLREQMFFSRKAAMIEDSVLMVRLAREKSDSTDEYGLMPFFNPGKMDWARLYMVCYIGLNKHLAEEGNEKKYERVMEVMEYISTPEGQEALASDTGLMYSSLKGVPFSTIPEAAHVADALDHGRYAIFKEFEKVQPTLREGLTGMLKGELTKEQVGDMIDEANVSEAVAQEEREVIGTAQEGFTLMETGNFITDVMKKQGDAEIALFLDGGKDGRYNNKGVTAKLYKGSIVKNDIVRIMPDYQYGEKGELWLVTMKGGDLLKTLEHAIQVDNKSDSWFYYFSGLRMQFNPSAEPGQRITSITMEDGSKIEANKSYKIAVMEHTVPEQYVDSCEKTGLLISDLLVEEIQKQKQIVPLKDGRFQID